MATISTLFHRLAYAMAASAAASRTWRAFLVVLVVKVSYLALVPAPPVSIDLGWDKLNHMLAFTTLAFSGYLSYPFSTGRRALILFGLLIFGGLIEVLQLFVPGRSSEWADLLADSIGIACGALIAAYVLRAASARSAR